MRRSIKHAFYTAAAAGVTLSAFGLAGAASSAAGVPENAGAVRAAGSPVYDTTWSGYQASGRWFRFIGTAVTVPRRVLPEGSGGNTVAELGNAAVGVPTATIAVAPGGGAKSVTWAAYPNAAGTFALKPAVGDRLSLSIYYDRHGRDYFTVTDLTKGVTRTARAVVGHVAYTRARLAAAVAKTAIPPRADVQLWPFKNSHLTTYTGRHGTVQGPWVTSAVIQTSTGTPAGRVITSPSGLWRSGANFGIWRRALPVVYTPASGLYTGFAGYEVGNARFRFIAASVTMPPGQDNASNAGRVSIGLKHNGRQPGPYAEITILAGGGLRSLFYDSPTGTGRFTVVPKPGDKLLASVLYDQHGHYRLTVTDITTGTSQTVTARAPGAAAMPLNGASAVAGFDNPAVTSPPADIALWKFTGIQVITYQGTHGSILGPWATSKQVDTTTGTRAGAVVADASALSGGGRNFSIWLRSR